MVRRETASLKLAEGRANDTRASTADFSVSTGSIGAVRSCSGFWGRHMWVECESERRQLVGGSRRKHIGMVRMGLGMTRARLYSMAKHTQETASPKDLHSE
eukprot:1728388-Alexandrium_andersonii.AAC.2